MIEEKTPQGKIVSKDSTMKNPGKSPFVLLGGFIFERVAWWDDEVVTINRGNEPFRIKHD